MAVLTEAKKAGSSAPSGRTSRERQPDGLGETVIQSMWSPAVTAVRSKGIPCIFQPLKEGYRSWATGFCLSKGVRQEGRLGLRVRQLVPVGLAGAYLNRRATTRPSCRPPRPHGTLRVGYWMEGKPAEKDIKAPDGSLLEKAGAVRDGVPTTNAWRRRVLERRHGRERLHGPQVERVHRGVMDFAMRTHTPLIPAQAGIHFLIQSVGSSFAGRAESGRDSTHSIVFRKWELMPSDGRSHREACRRGRRRRRSRSRSRPSSSFRSAFVVLVSFWDYNDYEIISSLTTRSYTETFEGCLVQLPDLCTILKTYVST